jgi:hypothetical protein
VALHDEVVDIRGVQHVEGVQGEVVEDQQVHSQQLAHVGVMGVVEPGGRQLLQ